MNTMLFGPKDEQGFWARRDELVEEFGGWLRAVDQDEEPGDFAMLLDHKWGYGDGRLDRWRTSDLSRFLLEWCPRHLTASPEQFCTIPGSVGIAMVFLAQQGLLASSSDPVERLLQHALGLQDEFEEKMADPAQFGMAKSIFAQLGIEDPTSLTPEDLDAAMAGFNALPMEERLAVTDPAIARQHAPRNPRIGPVVMPPADAVRLSAEAALVLAQFETLAGYLAAPGRTLTARGNLTIADARALSELMHTSDVYEATYGDRVYRKHTATQFIELDHWQWWARESGAIRKVGNKLVGVKAWQQRRVKDPVQEIRRAFEVLITFGTVSGYYPRGLADLEDLMDDSVGPLLGRLVDVGGPVTYEELEEVWLTIIHLAGASEPYPGAAGRSLRLLLTILERCGVLTQSGIEKTPGRHGETVLSGGTIVLTAVGTLLAVELVREQGVIVDIEAAPENLSAAELAESFSRLDPVIWWALAGRWLDRPSDLGDHVEALIQALSRESLVTLLMVLDSAPEDRLPQWLPTLTSLALGRDAPLDELGLVALDWLVRHDHPAVSSADPMVVQDARWVTLGLIAEDDPGLVAGVVADGSSTPEQLHFIRDVGQRLPPRAVDLLAALGSASRDKVVAKAARKELFRVRSKLLTREQNVHG